MVFLESLGKNIKCCNFLCLMCICCSDITPKAFVKICADSRSLPHSRNSHSCTFFNMVGAIWCKVWRKLSFCSNVYTICGIYKCLLRNIGALRFGARFVIFAPNCAKAPKQAQFFAPKFAPKT